MKYDDDYIIKKFNDRIDRSRNILSKWFDNAQKDHRFFHGNSDNNGQWSPEEINRRELSGKPITTNNIIQAHSRQIENDCFQKKFEPRIKTVGFDASDDAATALTGIIRHVINKNNAQGNAFMTAIEHQIRIGLGFCHVECDYEDEKSFNQDIKISSIKSPFSVLFDTSAQNPDMSDMEWACIESTITKDEFNSNYGDYEDYENYNDEYSSMGGIDYNSDPDRITIYTYYAREIRKEILISYQDQNGNIINSFKSEIDKDLFNYLKKEKAPTRKTYKSEVYKYIIVNNEIVDKTLTPFDFIPIVPFVGNVDIDAQGIPDFYGIVRILIDSQIGVNQALSTIKSQEYLSTNAQYIAPIESLASERVQSVWSSANASTAYVLPYESKDSKGNPLPAPTRIPPAQIDPSCQYLVSQLLELAMRSTGQFQAEMGANGNEVSGTAIESRQRQSDTATFQYSNKQENSLIYIGKLFLSAIPKIYDVKRAVQIQMPNLTEQTAIIDPTISSPSQRFIKDPSGAMVPIEQAMPNVDPSQHSLIEGAILAVNPNIGKYDVTASIGQSYDSERQETVDSLMKMISVYPSIASFVAPTIIKNMDFPGSEEIANLVQNPNNSPEFQQLQQQLQQLQAQNANLTTELKDKSAIHKLELLRLQHEISRDVAKNENDVYKNTTSRLAAIGETNPGYVEKIVPQLVSNGMDQEGNEAIEYYQVANGNQNNQQNIPQNNQQNNIPEDEQIVHPELYMHDDAIVHPQLHIPSQQAPKKSTPTSVNYRSQNSENIPKMPNMNQPGGEIRSADPTPGDVN